MNDSISAIITAISDLLGSILWPATLITVILLFRRPLERFVGNLQEVTVKSPGGGLEASISARVEASVAAATVSKTNADQQDVEVILQEAQTAAARIVSSSGLTGKAVLWVDDRPNNNRYERAALVTLGLQIVESTSTSEALDQVGKRNFDMVISDMSRPGDQLAGLTLLDRLRRMDNNLPYVIYAGSRAPEAVAEAEHRGATAYTDRPSELIEIVSHILSR